jgi:hypothetical protein
VNITPRTAHTSLDASAVLLKAIAPRVAQGIGTCRLMIDTGGDLERREDAGIRGKGWITDPTGQTALARLATHERTLEDVEQYLDTIRTSVALLVAWADKFAPRVTEHPRCHATGAESVEPWARPDCENLISYQVRPDGTISYRGDGLCDRCRMAKSRHKRQTEAA